MPEQFAARRDVGQRRAGSTNQDQAVAERLPDGSVVLAVADGVGGMGGGDVASAAAIAAVLEECRREIGPDPEDLLQRCFHAANDRVRQLATENFQHSNMASTLVAIIVREGVAWVASLGDSRAYLLAGDKLEQLTADDSWVAEQVRARLLTEEQAQTSPQRNVITRGIGVEVAPAVATKRISLPGGGALLLCSDGLHGVVPKDRIREILRSGSPENVCQALIDAANEAGGPDNIGVVVYRVELSTDDTEEITLIT